MTAEREALSELVRTFDNFAPDAEWRAAWDAARAALAAPQDSNDSFLRGYARGLQHAEERAALAEPVRCIIAACPDEPVRIGLCAHHLALVEGRGAPAQEPRDMWTRPFNHVVPPAAQGERNPPTAWDLQNAGKHQPGTHVAQEPPAAQGEPPTMEDAISAGDGTLHGAIDYWQSRCKQQDDAIAALMAELDAAKLRAQYWKDEHIAANVEIERAEAELHQVRCERDEAQACIATSAETIAALRAENIKLRGWVNDAEQAAGREQRLAERAEAERAALLEEAEYTLRMLQAEKCPSCYGGGTTPYGDQCEWCFRRDADCAHLKAAIDAERDGK